MNAEGDDVKPETSRSTPATPPPARAHLDTSWARGTSGTSCSSSTEHGGTTTLTFSQSVPDAEMAAGIGPGWEYYLDRLVAAETGADVAAIDFATTTRGQSDHYRAMFG